MSIPVGARRRLVITIVADPRRGPSAPSAIAPSVGATDAEVVRLNARHAAEADRIRWEVELLLGGMRLPR